MKNLDSGGDEDEKYPADVSAQSTDIPGRTTGLTGLGESKEKKRSRPDLAESMRQIEPRERMRASQHGVGLQ